MADSRPAWQTDDLADEWIEEESAANNEHDDADGLTRSISLTIPLPSHIKTYSEDHENDQESRAEPNPGTFRPPGTFLVRDDVPAAPLLPKTPGKKPKGMIKDFFTPLPLERMFEPPSPPVGDSSPLDSPTATAGGPPMAQSRFTFAVPRQVSNGMHPQAQSTPGPHAALRRNAPSTDPRLRLFQFQYDTFTREHLSAMVDSIAHMAADGMDTMTTTPGSRGLSRVSEAPSSIQSRFRSAKRVKLSPQSDFHGEGVGEGAQISRPMSVNKDYVGESQSLMQQIRQARDFSTMSTVASAPEEPTPPLPEKHKLPTPPESRAPSSGSLSRPQSSTSIRQNALAFMAQIKSDIKTQRRIFSGDTEFTHTSIQADNKLSNYPPTNPTIQAVQNEPDTSLRHSRSSSLQSSTSSRSRLKVKPRPLSSDVERDLVAAVGDLSLQGRPQPPGSPPRAPSTQPLRASLGPTSYPSATVRAATNDDLNRFVSSSTTTSTGTTLTTGSRQSYVKHAGPPQLRQIRPEDVPPLPSRVGNMIYDPSRMRWVKSATDAGGEDDRREAVDASEDPFRDIESIHEDDSEIRDAPPVDERGHDEGFERHDISRIEERSEAEEAEEAALNSFSFDVAPGVPAPVTPDQETDATTDTEDEDDDDGPLSTATLSEQGDRFDAEDEPPAPPSHTMTPMHQAATPIRSVLKSTSATPISAANRICTPAPRTMAHPRSVSFSDGKRDGPIRGLNGSDIDSTVTSLGLGDEPQPSVRSKRIAEMMEALENSESDGDPSPLKSSSSKPEPLTKRVPSSIASVAGSSPRRVFSRPHSRTSRRSPSPNKSNVNATFLTECSFGVSRDKLVQAITEVQPYEPNWEDLAFIDLSSQGLESVARLKDFLPKLDGLNVNSNSLNWLSGIPGTLRTLSVASNMLTGLTSYSHLSNLQSLDISQNDIDSLRQLSCLRHLRELRADGNNISDLDGLQKMAALVKLSIASNCVRGEVDLTKFGWSKLEMLNLSENKLEGIHGLDSLVNLIALNADGNVITSFSGRAARLRILRLSNNRLGSDTLDVSGCANLKTLYVDNNSLTDDGIKELHKLVRLENLSVRNQWGKGKTRDLGLKTRDVRDCKRMYLSGNPIALKELLTEPCYNLVYLELASCRLTWLPPNMSAILPNLRSLNLNYNFLGDGAGVEEALTGLKRMKKLSMVGSRLRGTKAVIKVLRGMPDLEIADFRMNPCTLEWYLPLMMGGEQADWKEMDRQFRRDLPDRVYVRRLAYRGHAMAGCGRLRVLDGVEVTGKERAKAVALVGLPGGR